MVASDITTLADALQSSFPVIILDFRAVDRFLYRIRDLQDLRDGLPKELIDRLDNCHIYMIGKRPRLSVVADSISWNDHRIRLRVSCSINGVVHEGDMTLDRPKELREAKSFEASPFPHRELLALDGEGRVMQHLLLANFAHLVDSLPSFAKQLEVLYVGKGLAKNTQDRLSNHKTLQQVLAEVSSDDPEGEVFALVYRFDYRRSAGGVVTSGADAAERDLRRKLKPYKPTAEDQVSLVEAAIISYFHTDRFNSHYIDFPATDTDAARRAREAGADYLAVQVDAEALGRLPTYSQRVEPQVTHHIVRRITR